MITSQDIQELTETINSLRGGLDDLELQLAELAIKQVGHQRKAREKKEPAAESQQSVH